jgi:hypothetical protein
MVDAAIAEEHAVLHRKAHEIAGQIALADLVLVGDHVLLAPLVEEQQTTRADDAAVLRIGHATEEGAVHLERILIRQAHTRTDQRALVVVQRIGNGDEDLLGVDGPLNFIQFRASRLQPCWMRVLPVKVSSLMLAVNATSPKKSKAGLSWKSCSW